jgi:hypothetical protein
MTTPYEKLHQCGHASSGFLKDGKYQSHDSRAAGLYSGAWLAERWAGLGQVLKILYQVLAVKSR